MSFHQMENKILHLFSNAINYKKRFEIPYKNISVIDKALILTIFDLHEQKKEINAENIYEASRDSLILLRYIALQNLQDKKTAIKKKRS